MSEPNDPNPTPEKLLAGVIAEHFIDAQVVEDDGVQVVQLGEGLPVIEWPHQFDAGGAAPRRLPHP